MTTLAGAPNFRPVAAYPTTDNQYLRPGMLFRSGALSALTETDLTTLETLDIKLVADLRSAAERRRFPTKWPALHPARTIAMPTETDREAGMQPLIDRLARQPGAEGARAAMLDLYAALPGLLAPILQETFDSIITGWGVPVLLHCHVGKDRTGVATAIILTALGVKTDAILADYLETTNRIDIETETRHLARTLGTLLGRAIDPGTLDQLGRTDPAYLAAAFTAITQQYGSTANYLTTLNLTPDRRSRLKSLLLIPERAGVASQ